MLIYSSEILQDCHDDCNHHHYYYDDQSSESLIKKSVLTLKIPQALMKEIFLCKRSSIFFFQLININMHQIPLEV